MESDDSIKGRNYEILIQRAFNCKKGKRHGADGELLLNLLHLEKNSNDSLLYKRRFNKLKTNIERALYRLKKRKRYFNSHEEFMPLFIILDKAKCADHLTIICNKALAKMIECENRLRESG